MANLYECFLNEGEGINISETDKIVHDYVWGSDNQRYEKVLQEEKRLQVHVALSELRKGLFSWYPFRDNSTILEIGGSYGALTGMFCEKAKKVAVTERSLYRAQIIEKRYENVGNLDIYAGDITNMSFEEGFDYIILTGILERIGKGTFDERVYADYLCNISRFLKPDGVILASVDNRYGFRYFAGMKDIHTGRVFDSIRRYPQGNGGAHSFTRSEIDNICAMTGFEKSKVYYPLPDYRFPQLIYSDAHLPEKNLRERLIPYYPDHTSVIFNENINYNDLVENNVFPFFANSFLVELTNASLSETVYAAVSTDRGREKSFATVIYGEEKVLKKPLYDEGAENAILSCEHIADIKAHGLSVAEHTWDGEKILMPYIKHETLSNYIKSIIAANPDEVKDIVERLWQNILKSSEETNAEENRLLNEETKALNWGPVLKKAYMELIPLNCFYDKGEFIYFDQEFVRENYPAKYVLFRAIHYIYVFTVNAEKYIPLSYFKEKYEMEDLWSIFMQEENKFLAEVRKHDEHRVFYQWAYPDAKRMQQNTERLNKIGTSPVQIYQSVTLKEENKKPATETGKPYKIGYVPGVYDLFHVGHLNLIRRSKERCEHLIVGVLTDELVEHFKGKKPYIPYEERAAIIGAIREVDEVVAVDFSNTRKMDAWNLYHYDCHFSGNDHGPDWAKELERLREVGSNMEFFEYTQGTSSTQIKQEMAGR